MCLIAFLAVLAPTLILGRHPLAIFPNRNV
jgi:hypothetical protein